MSTSTGVIPVTAVVPKVIPLISSKKKDKPKTEQKEETKPAINEQIKTETAPKEALVKKSIPDQKQSEIKAIKSGDLAFTLDLGNFNSPKPELFENIDGITETVGPDNRYHYTYGKFKNHKEASKAQKDIAAKGFKTSKIRILSNNNLVKEKTGGETYYTIQIMALNLPIEVEFFDNLDNVQAFNGHDGFTRYTYKKIKSYKKAVTEMNRLIRMGYWDAFVRTVINDQLLYAGMKYMDKSTYTIQVMALRKPRPLSYFNDLGNVQVFVDENGLYRYTYGTYQTKNDAILDLGTALKKGYWDAFVRKSLRGERLPFIESIDKTDYYTIQVMALKNAKPLNYFDNLGIDNMKIYNGSDGLSRYTFQKFPSLSQAKSRLSSVTQKGYFDAFTREIKWYNQH